MSLAQQSFYISSSIGKIQKRDNVFDFDVSGISFGNELTYRKPLMKDGGWQKYWHNPTFKTSLGYYHFNNNSLGTSIYVLPGLSFDIYKIKDFSLSWGIRTGLSYLSKKYNQNSNPLNNAIGANWNNSIAFDLQGLLLDRWIFSLGLLHFSNGLKAVPNRGLNTFNLTIEYKLGAKKNTSIVSETKESKRKYKNSGLEAGYRLGVSEVSVPKGPKYSVHTLYAGYIYRKSPHLDWVLGVDYEYNYARFNFFFGDFSTREESNKKAKSTSIYAAANLHFGAIVAHLQTGAYLPTFSTRKETMYTLLGLRYYIINTGKIKPYAGFSLKSHFARAESMGIDFGLSF